MLVIKYGRPKKKRLKKKLDYEEEEATTLLYLLTRICTTPEAVFSTATAWSCLASLKSCSLTFMI